MGAEDPLFILYTSGSTGQPKGVLIEHGGLADYLCWAERQYVRGDRLTFPLFTSLGFDLTVTSLFLPLISGGTLEIYPEPDGPVDTALVDVVTANSADFIKLTPSHLSLLRRIGLEGSRIRRMVVGGEDLKTALAAAVSAQLHDRVEIYNEYGPTEAVVGCVAHRYDPERDTGASVPIGAPADHVTVEILNEALSPVPEGVPGELWISRFGLARGYHGLEKLTADRFPAHPARPGERRYRTGDRVRMADPDTLEYLGRLDRQVKVSGFRVEPGEIEAALLSLPMIEQCAVVARQRPGADPRASEAVRHCARCGLPSNYPRTVFDDEGVCGVCRSYDTVRDHAQAYFRTMDDLRALFEASGRAHRPEYDCLMLYSGGKDSTYALCRLVEMGLSVYAFTLDNGYISEGAKENIRKVTGQLGVPVDFAETPAMNAIFRDSLMRFSNVCNGCFKTIYTLSMKRARDLGIPIIVTGLSRGQMFETRLTEEMFRDGRRRPEEVDAAVLAARKAYHRVPDEVSRSLDVEIFRDDRIFEEVRFVDFYRYCDVGMDELYSYLEEKVPWVRPKDTGRSTNCLINDVGIYVHKKERGHHSYALPYSWDVRLGHKTRDGAREELEDTIDVDHVRRILGELGYDEERVRKDVAQTALAAFYVASGDVSDQELRRQLGERLPSPLVPLHLQRVDSLPLTVSGKVDERALAQGAFGPRSGRPYRAPEGPVEEYLAGVWQEELGVERVGADDSFFELGGTSLATMQVMVRLCREFDIELPLETPFSRPRLSDLAKAAEDRILADAAEIPDAERERLLEDDGLPR
jgi:amino acid adenylation domain-containing protein